MSLKEKIQKLNPWFYSFKLDNEEVIPAIESKHSTEELVVQTKYFKNILVDQILDLYNFKYKKILDVGSNCGYWSYLYALNGANQITCIEGRDKFIQQGKLLFSVNKILPDDKVNFIHSDVTNDLVWSGFQDECVDFVLCSGILYHIVEHERLLENIHRCAKEAVLIDTRVSAQGSKKTQAFKEDGLWSFDAIPSNQIAKHPTKEFLINFFVKKNYKVVEIKSPHSFPLILSKNDNYDKGKRITFLAIKNG